MSTVPPDALHVLIVDDDPLLGRVASRALTRAGFRTSLFTTAAAAREAAAATAARIDAVVVDLRLRDGWGPTLAAELRALRPGLPVVLASGDVQGPQIASEISQPSGFLAKPFRATELERSVRAVVSQQPASGAAPTRA